MKASTPSSKVSPLERGHVLPGSRSTPFGGSWTIPALLVTDYTVRQGLWLKRCCSQRRNGVDGILSAYRHWAVRTEHERRVRNGEPNILAFARAIVITSPPRSPPRSADRQGQRRDMSAAERRDMAGLYWFWKYLHLLKKYRQIASHIKEFKRDIEKAIVNTAT